MMDTEEKESPAEEVAETQIDQRDLEANEKANLAPSLTEEEAKKLKRRCIDRYQRDLASRAPRMKKLRELHEMYAMIAKPKSFPFHRAANVRTPTVAGPNLQIQSRLFDMLVPASGDLMHVLAATGDEREIAHVAESFGNTYLRHYLPEFEQGMDLTIHEVCLYGSAFRRTYADATMRRICSDPVSIEDFVVAYGHRSRDPSLSNVEFYTYVHHKSVAEIKELGGEGGAFVNTDKISEETNTAIERSDLQQAIDKQQGTEIDEEFEPHQVLECHCRFDLPKDPGRHPAFDGKRHYLVVYIDWPSETILRVSLREEDDPDDVRRFEREMAKVSARKQEIAVAMNAASLQMMQMPQMPPSPMMGQVPPQMPVIPEPLPPPQPVRKRQICFFTHYRCFESGGFYGLGYGDILYGLALAKNTLINQHIDGITLKNAKPLFMSRQVRMQKGNISVQPGEVVEIDGPVSAVKDALMWLDPPQNDPSTIPLIQMLDGMSDILVGSADMMSGQVPGSNQAATSVQIFAEQAMTPITVLGRRLMNCFKHELDKVWRCFGVFLADEEIADIVRDSGNPLTANVGRALFSPTARLMPAADPRTKAQREKEFQNLVGFLNSNPVTAPQANPAIAREIAVMGLKLFPDGSRLAQFLPPPPGEQGPPPAKKYWEEDADFLDGKPSQVHPDDNDDEHLQGHIMSMQGDADQLLPKDMRDAKEQHIRSHHAQRLRKGMSQIEQQKAELLGSGGGGPGPMEGQPPDGAVPGPVA